MQSSSALIANLIEGKRAMASKWSGTLDVWRILAALMVILFHWLNQFTGQIGHLNSPIDLSWVPSSLVNFSKFGLLGVDIFFILSGSLILYSAMNSNASKFALSRFLRLFPVYVIAVVLHLSIVPFVDSGFVTRSLTWPPYIIDVAWTLWLEIRFYALIFLLLIMSNKFRFNSRSGAFVIFLSLWTIISVLDSFVNSPILHFFALRGFAFEFILGAVAYLISERYSNPRLLILCVSGFFSLLKILSRTPIIALEDINTENLIQFVFISLVFLALIFSIIFRGTIDSVFPSRSFNGVRVLSLMTYPLYLLHNGVGISIISILNKNLNIKMCYFLSMIIVLCLSYFIVTQVETRLKQYLMKVIGRLQ